MILPNGKNYSLVGGWFDQGDGLKVSYSIATTVAMLSWSYADLRDGYTSSRTDDTIASSIRWGAEYLMKCHVTNMTGVTDMFVGQVRRAGGVRAARQGPGARGALCSARTECRRICACWG
jgi:hypothetical protein